MLNIMELNPFFISIYVFIFDSDMSNMSVFSPQKCNNLLITFMVIYLNDIVIIQHQFTKIIAIQLSLKW